MNAKEARIIANKKVKEQNTIDEENRSKSLNYFIKTISNYAKMGRLEARTTCLVHKSGNTYYCQTETGGDGFEVKDINLLINDLKKLNYNVTFKKKKGYCPLVVNWAEEL